jgi:signal transduction histidine kinase/ActR/RegA family two-component response regulator
VEPVSIETETQHDLSWRGLPPAARWYVIGVITAGAAACVYFFPRSFPHPVLFAAVVAAACITSVLKVNLPIPLTSGSTLSVAYAANLVALLLLGAPAAVTAGVAGTWAQCTLRPKQRYPLYRTLFSMAVGAITMAASAIVYARLAGPPAPLEFSKMLEPLAAAIVTCFLVNTVLVAGAIALSTSQTVWRIWQSDFVWGGASFMVAGTAGAVAALMIQRGEHWKALLALAPIYLIYRTYQLFVLRLEERDRHLEETRRLHQEADAARASAETANMLKDQFLATVSHELRTPLNAILGWAEMLRRGQLDGPRLDRATRAIHDSARRQAQIIDELLDVARIMSGKLRLDPAPVEMTSIVRSAVEVVQPSAESKRIHIAIETETPAAFVHGDSSRLQQVVWNLLSNAVKFTPDEGLIRVRIQARRGALELSVIDDGPGIPPEFLPYVFEPFRQADGSTTRTHGGLGLGLSIVKQLVVAHNGSVRVTSDGAGRGATFVVTLPLMRGVYRAAPPAESVRPQETTVPASLQGLSVMVVDDDDASRQVVAAHLEARHANVVTAASAAEAIDLLQRQKIDVLLADVAMPGEDGYSLIRRVRALGTPEVATVPAAALTAFAREEDRERALQAGFQLHLAKPVDADVLVTAVAALRGYESLIPNR